MTAGTVHTPPAAQNGAWPPPPPPPAAPSVFLAGSASTPWRDPVVAAIAAAGVTVVDPVNPRYFELTQAEHDAQCQWELDWLQHPEVTVAFWFPAGQPSSVSMFELGMVLTSGKGRSGKVVLGADPGGSLARDVAARAKMFGVAHVHTSVDDLTAAVLRGTAAAVPSSRPPSASAPAPAVKGGDGGSVKTSPAPGGKRGRDYIGVGCGAFVFDEDDRVLLIKRSEKSSIEPGRWARPGGAVELGETCEEAVIREMKEEVNADIDGITLTDVTTQKDPYWVAVGYTARLTCAKTAVRNNEPHKHPEMGWFALDDLPVPLASFVVPILEKMRADPNAYLPAPSAKRRRVDTTT